MILSVFENRPTAGLAYNTMQTNPAGEHKIYNVCKISYRSY